MLGSEVWCHIGVIAQSGIRAMEDTGLATGMRAYRSPLCVVHLLDLRSWRTDLMKSCLERELSREALSLQCHLLHGMSPSEVERQASALTDTYERSPDILHDT